MNNIFPHSDCSLRPHMLHKLFLYIPSKLLVRRSSKQELQTPKIKWLLAGASNL